MPAVTLEEVAQAAESLTDRGVEPGVLTVREELKRLRPNGRAGSNREIGPLLGEWRKAAQLHEVAGLEVPEAIRAQSERALVALWGAANLIFKARSEDQAARNAEQTDRLVRDRDEALERVDQFELQVEGLARQVSDAQAGLQAAEQRSLRAQIELDLVHAEAGRIMEELKAARAAERQAADVAAQTHGRLAASQERIQELERQLAGSIDKRGSKK